MSKALLHQIVAVEKSTKGRAMSLITEIHHANQKKDLFVGLDKKYNAFNAEDKDVPPDQYSKVQRIGETVLKAAAKQLIDLFDISATRDWGNCIARADVTLPDGKVLISNAPATFLLFLEKRLIDVRTMIDETPSLDPAETWEKDVNSNLHKSAVIKSIRTAKIKKVFTTSAATDKHQAVGQLVDIDEAVGTWSTIKLSGALPIPRKEQLLDRVEVLLRAVKFARERANSVEVENINVGEKLFGFLLAD